MGYEVGYSEFWQRDIGYGVPAFCDCPRCKNKIDRGLGYMCEGCGLYFCTKHLAYCKRKNDTVRLCPRCSAYRTPYNAKPDAAEWEIWKLTDSSWGDWRKNNPEAALQLRQKHEHN